MATGVVVLSEPGLRTTQIVRSAPLESLTQPAAIGALVHQSCASSELVHTKTLDVRVPVFFPGGSVCVVEWLLVEFVNTGDLFVDGGQLSGFVKTKPGNVANESRLWLVLSEN
jgi:hypothetical protein